MYPESEHFRNVRLDVSSERTDSCKRSSMRDRNWKTDLLGITLGLVNRKRCGNVVPKYAPSRPPCLLDGGWYTSWQAGQYNATACMNGASDRPEGSTGCCLQDMRGHVPNTRSLNFTYYTTHAVRKMKQDYQSRA